MSTRSIEQDAFRLPRTKSPLKTKPKKRLPRPTANTVTVRDVAQRLLVCSATVYKLCAAGELVHVRISNAIRVAPTDLAEFIARRRRG